MGSTVQGDIGVRIGLEQDLERGIARLNKALENLAATVEQIGQRIDKAMRGAAAGAKAEEQAIKKATKAQQEHGAAAEQASKKAVGAAKAEEQAVKQTTKAHQEQGKAADQAGKQAAGGHDKGKKHAQDHHNQVMQLQMAYVQVTAVMGAVTAALGYLAKESKEAFSETERASKGLESAAQKTAESFRAANEAANRLADDGLTNVMENSRALQNYMVSGFSLDEARELVEISKNAASFNRQAGFTIGEAVVRMSEGVRLGMSQVSDAAGITKNLSQILKEQGKAETDVMNIQSDASVRQALLNGLRKEGALFAGNAAKAAEGLAGAEAKSANEAFKAKTAFGESLAPAIQTAFEAMNGLLGKVADFAQENPALARSLFLVVGGITAAATAVGTLTVAFLALNSALGPVGWALMGISALIGAIGGAALAAQATEREHRRQMETVRELGLEYDRLSKTIDSAATTAEDKQRAQEELRRVIAEIGDLMPELVTKWDAEGRAIELNTEKVRANTEAVTENLRIKRQDEAFQAANDEANARDALNKFLAAKQAQEMQRQAFIIEQVRYAGPAVNLNEETRRKAEEEAAAEWDKRYAEQEAALRKALAEAEAKTNRLSKMAGALTTDERGRGSYTTSPPPTTSSVGGSGTGTGSGSPPPDPFKTALRQVDHLRTMDQITGVEEIAMLEEVKAAHAKTAEQIMEIDERIHTTRRRLTEEDLRDTEKARQAKLSSALRWLDFGERMGVVNHQMEIARLTEILETFELTEEEKLALLERRYATEQDMAREAARLEEERARAAKQAEEEALRARETAQRQAAQAQLEWIRAIADAELTAIQRTQDATERAQQERIRGLQDQLSELERIWDAEDRRSRLQDLRNELGAVMADTRYQMVDESGKLVYTYDEARAAELQKQIADAELEEQRQQIREQMQAQIQAAQDELAIMQEAHRSELAERQAFWSGLQSLDLAQMQDLTDAAQEGLTPWVDVFRTKLGELQTLWEEKARAIEEAAARISAAIGMPSTPALSVPTLPASLAGATGAAAAAGVSVGQLSLSLPGVKDAQQFAQALPGALTAAGISLGSLNQTGRLVLQTR